MKKESLLLTAEQFLALIEDKKGDLSGICYTVTEDIYLCTEQGYNIKLGNGKFLKNFIIGIKSILNNLDFETSEFIQEPLIPRKVCILGNYNDRSFFKEKAINWFRENHQKIPTPYFKN